MKKVLVRAPLLTNSGYGVHSRQLFKWLLDKQRKQKDFDIHVQCLNWGMCPWFVDTDKCNGLVGEIMDRSVELEPPYDVTFQVQLPDEWSTDLGKYNVGVTAAVETDRCNLKWIERCNAMDEVVVPSTFTKNVLKRSGPVITDIKVIPEWYHSAIDDNHNEVDLDLDLKTKFNFLTVKMLTSVSPDLDRKNMFNTISWFCEKFKDNPDVGLIVKTSMGKFSSFDRKRTEAYFNEFVKSINKGLFPKIYLIHGDMSDKELASLYRKADCYVSLTRGEGYGLPLVESAASGLPIVVTNYSGHLEFLRPGTFLPVDYKMISVPQEKIDERIFIKGVRWAEADKKSYFTQLEEVYYNCEKYKNLASDNAMYIKSNFSQKAITNIYENSFRDLI